jgi:hypothetical protein
MNHRAADITIAIDYHERTEHGLPDRFEASLGYLDRETQPDPFRAYRRAQPCERQRGSHRHGGVFGTR